MKVVTIMPNNWLAERMDELIRAVDEIFVGKIPSEDDLYGIHQVLVERRDAEITRQSVTDDAVKDAISWLESDKNDRQREWEGSDVDWRMEPGSKEMHEDFMYAFDLAIQALRQMGSTEHSTRVTEPCEKCIKKAFVAYWTEDKDYLRCPYCGRPLKGEMK